MRRLILGLLALTTAVSAYDIFEDRCWEVGGEALFWRPCGQSYDYAVSRPRPFLLEDLSLKPDYDVGFRIWGATYTTDCCHLFDVDWTHLRTFDKQRKASPSLIVLADTQTLANAVANADLKFAYDKVEIRAGRYIARYCKSMAWAYGGVGYLNVKRDQTVTVVDGAGATVRSVQRAGYEGGLLEVGVGTDVEEPYCFHLLGQIGAAVGIGKRTLHHTLTRGDTITYNHPGATSCIVGLTMRLGVQWRYQCGCVWIMPQVSYQLDHYFDALRLVAAQPGFGGTEPVVGTNLQSVGFSGPSVSIAVRF